MNRRRAFLVAGVAASAFLAPQVGVLAALDDLTAQEVLYIGRTDAAVKIFGDTLNDFTATAQGGSQSPLDTPGFLEDLSALTVVWQYAADFVGSLTSPSPKIDRLSRAMLDLFAAVDETAGDIQQALARQSEAILADSQLGLERINELVTAAGQELDRVLA